MISILHPSRLVWCWLLTLSLVSANRVGVWENNDTLWLDAVIKSPSKPRANINYGEIQLQKGHYLQAEYYFTKAATLAHARPDQRAGVSTLYALINLAQVQSLQGRYQQMAATLTRLGCLPHFLIDLDHPSGTPVTREITWSCTVRP